MRRVYLNVLIMMQENSRRRRATQSKQSPGTEREEKPQAETTNRFKETGKRKQKSVCERDRWREGETERRFNLEPLESRHPTREQSWIAIRVPLIICTSPLNKRPLSTLRLYGQVGE